MSARSTKERPVDIAFSGPSGGAVGAAYLARRMGVPERPDVRHGRHLDRRRAVPRRRGRDQARGAARLLPVPGPRGRHPQRRRRRRLDRVPQPRRRAEGRPAQRRCRPRTRLLRARRDASRRSPTPTSCSAGCRAGPSSAGAWRSTSRRPSARWRRSPRAWASTPSRPRRRSSTSPTRTCTPRCASCRWSAATTRATSGSSPSAAPGRCTPTRSRVSSAPTRSSSRAPAGRAVSAFGFLAADVQNEFARTYLRPAEETPSGGRPRGGRRAHRGGAATWLDAEGVDDARPRLRRLRRLPLLPPGHPDPGGAGASTA